MTTVTRKHPKRLHQPHGADVSSKSWQQLFELLEAEIAFLRTIILRERAHVPAWAREPEDAVAFSVNGEPLRRYGKRFAMIFPM